MTPPRPSIPQALREKVAAEAGHRCGYCLTPQSFTAMPMRVEHIIPVAAGGPSAEHNLWLAFHCAMVTKALKPMAPTPKLVTAYRSFTRANKSGVIISAGAKTESR